MSGEKENSMNLTVSPSKKVKSARFQVATVDHGEEEENDPSTPLTADENGWTHQGSQRSHGVGGDTVQFTQYAKSLRYYLTREALPNENNYRNLLSFGKNSVKGQRPTLEELREEEGPAKLAKQEADGDVESQQKGKVIKFGWIEGVYMRCLLNIWGVMLFLRLTWVIGQCGLVQGLLVMTFCNVVTTITAISMSAVSTNGQIKGGGVYFMISRALGPEFGGAIGLMFTLANSIAVSMYVIGFSESLLDMFQAYIPAWAGIVDSDFTNFRTNDVRIIGSSTLVLILVLAIVGMDWVTRVQKALMILLLASQVDFIVGTFLPRTEEVYAKGFTGYSMDTMKTNLWSNYEEGEKDGERQSFFSVFAVFFPAVTGIVAGANLSGDLKDPAVAIPKGTLSAIASTYVTYMIYGTMVAFTYLPQASGNVTEYMQWTNESIPEGGHSVPNYLDCHARECQYGTLMNQQTMAIISCTGYLIYGGCFAATISSAIASLVGAPRVLQALAKDKLYPRVEFFSVGWGANNDPVRGYVLVFFISLGCILVGELNLVSSLLSNFFVAAYALINFSVFHASVTKSPGWRPAFKWYNPWGALFGSILCVFSMFAMDWVTALITFLITFVLYFYIYYRKPEANWGSSTQAQTFVNALKGVQSLTDTADHVKNYRPKVLVLTGNPAHRPPLVDFANLITKKLSLLICGHVITEPGSVHLSTLKESTQAWLTDRKIKGFYTVTESNTFEEGAKSCLTLAGLGKLSPNMLLMGFKADWSSDIQAAKEYFSVLHSGFDLAYSLGILRVTQGLDFSTVFQAEETMASEYIDDERRGSMVGIVQNDTNENLKVSEDPSNGEEDSPIASTPAPNKPYQLIRQRTKTRTISTSVYNDTEGNPLSKELVSDITQFQTKKRSGNIDVWWLYDDGGLTLLLPYILTTRQQFSDCKLRVFTLANRKDELDRETRNMAALLAKFRIDFSSVLVIPDVTKRATDESRARHNEMLGRLPEGAIDEEEMLANKEKTNRHLRLAELLQEHSKESELIVMTLPMPRKGTISAPLYLSWLDVMTENLPPTLLVRGNQTSVLTFYS